MGGSMLRVLRAIPGVRNVQRFTMKQGILKTNNDFLGVAFKGIAADYDTTFIHQNLVAGAIPHFSDSAGKQQVVISQAIADQLNLKLGDKVFAYFALSRHLLEIQKNANFAQ